MAKHIATTVENSSSCWPTIVLVVDRFATPLNTVRFVLCRPDFFAGKRWFAEAAAADRPWVYLGPKEKVRDKIRLEMIRL